MSMSSSDQVIPKVSIGLPVYNGADYLALSINSILAQTYSDFELIIFDNASTDGTERICREFALKDPRVQYFRQPKNVGATANFRSVFEHSRADYFRFQAHDDILAPTFLERTVAVLDEDPDCVLAYTKTILIDAAGNQTQCYLDFMACDSDDPAVRLATWLMPSDGLCNPNFGLMRRATVKRMTILPPYPSSDRVFLAHLTLLGRVREWPECLFFRRHHERMSTLAHEDKQDLQAWHDGGGRRKIILERWRLVFGFLGVINTTPMPLRSRLMCYRHVGKWMYFRRRILVKELMLPLYLNGRPTRLGSWVKRAMRS